MATGWYKMLRPHKSIPSNGQYFKGDWRNVVNQIINECVNKSQFFCPPSYIIRSRRISVDTVLDYNGHGSNTKYDLLAQGLSRGMMKHIMLLVPGLCGRVLTLSE